jgi:hypothetical protein
MLLSHLSCVVAAVALSHPLNVCVQIFFLAVSPHMFLSGMILGCELLRLLRGQGFPATFKASGSTAKEDDVKIPDSWQHYLKTAILICTVICDCSLNILLCCVLRHPIHHQSITVIVRWAIIIASCLPAASCVVKDIQLNRIAGNSIAIPAIGSIIAILLACTEMISSKSDLKSPSPRQRQHHADSTEPVWVGLGRVAAREGKFDCLLPSNQLKKRTLNSKEDDQQTLDRFVQRKAGKAEKCERQ